MPHDVSIAASRCLPLFANMPGPVGSLPPVQSAVPTQSRPHHCGIHTLLRAARRFADETAGEDSGSYVRPRDIGKSRAESDNEQSVSRRATHGILRTAESAVVVSAFRNVSR